jgi:hypothetical protein
MRNARSPGRLGLLGFLGPGLVAACVGGAPPPTGDDDDNPGDVPAQVQRVSGKAMDYFVAGTPLTGVTLASDGIDPPLMVTSAADGAFAVDEVPVGSQLFFSASRTGYRPTRNLVAIADAAVVQDVYLMSAVDISRQYATDGGKTPKAGTAFVVADLQRNNGTPLSGVPLTSVKLVDTANAPVAGVIGPYSFGATGDIAPVVTQTEAHGGKARVAFLDVPAGRFSLKVTFTDGQGQQQTITTPVTTVADGATLVRSGGTGSTVGGGGTGAGGGGPPANPRFVADIFPRLQTAANGGRGCANCHTVGGIGSVAVFNALAADVLASMKAKTGLLDLAAPANSLLLTKPLYEAPPAVQNHPNATFVDATDPDYKLILLWLQQGALP